MDKSITAIRLREAMDRKNLRQVDLLEKCKPYCRLFDVKLTQAHLSQYLSGKFLPKQDKLTVLASALDVSEAWLMGYDVEQTQQRMSRLETYMSMLNEAGQEKVEDYIMDLVESWRYSK